MPRPSEIAADARALYGPLDLRPAAGDLGDGALWVDPGSDGALYQVQSGNWVRIAGTGATGALGTAPAGTPTLRGPYVVDYTDIPHDGDTLALWTPAVGDVLLRLVVDGQSLVAWDHGQLFVGPNVDGTVSPPHNQIGWSNGTSWNEMDLAFEGRVYNASGVSVSVTAYVFTTTDPVQIQLAQTSGTDPGAGHVELYALTVRAVAP